MFKIPLNLKEKSYYDFLCGRVKVLETYLIEEPLYKDLVKKNFREFVQFLQGYPYKNFLIGEDFQSVKDAIIKRKEFEFSDFEKFGLKDFIDVFFRSSAYFLLTKKKDFVSPPSLPGFSEILTSTHNELFATSKTYLRPLVIDANYLTFLFEGALLLRNDFIIDFYRELTENYIIMILMRNYRFVQDHFLGRSEFDEILRFLSLHFPYSTFLRKVTDFNEFEEMLRDSKGLYFEKDISSEWTQLLNKTLKKAFEKGRYLNEGIEPIFVYLLKIDWEAHILQKLAYALYFGVDPGEITELEFAYE